MHALKHAPVFTECRQLKGGLNPRLLWQNEDAAFDPAGDFSAITAPVFGVVPLAVGSALKRLTGSNATLRIGMRPSVGSRPTWYRMRHFFVLWQVLFLIALMRTARR